MNQSTEFNHLIHKDEKKYFILSILVSIIGYIFLFISISGIFILLTLLTLSSLLHLLSLSHIRLNGIRLSDEQFPEVFSKIKEISSSMGMTAVPDIYVIQSGGVLNAFATRFFKKNMIIVYSEIFDLINTADSDVVNFIIAHEIAHIKRNHISKQLFILPSRWIPFLSEAYSRACEYTCDRIAAHYINNPEAAMDSLTMLAVGTSLFKKVNRRDYLYQSSRERGLFPMLIEKLSTHPTIPKRINEIQILSGESLAADFNQKSRFKLTMAVAVLVILSLSVTGFLYADEIFSAIDGAFNYLPFYQEESLVLIQSIVDGDLEQVKLQLEEGINPNIQDADGWTPLMWAANDNNTDMISIFINAGADPNLQDYYGTTPLIIASMDGDIEAIKILLEFGADPNLAESFGWTPLMNAANSGNIEAVKLLLAAGADPSIRDEDNFTAFLRAKKAGYHEIADLIKQHENSLNN